MQLLCSISVKFNKIEQNHTNMFMVGGCQDDINTVQDKNAL